MTYICNYCNKNFKKIDNYKKHILFCEVLHKSKKEKEDDEEEFEKTPSIHEIFHIVKELTIKYDKLQRDNENLKQIINTRKKKINVIDWLNFNCKPDETFINWISKIELRENQLEYIFDQGNIEGTLLILQDICSNNNNLPLKCFTQKENTFYIYEKNNNKYEWKIISNEELVLFFGNLNKKILSLFKIWQEKNTEKLENDDFALEYIQKVRKILGKGESIEVENIKLKNKLYKFLKINIKTIIEYDFS